MCSQRALHAASEEDLACRVQDGCADSFTELANRLQPRLMFVLRRRLGHEADAEDVAQRTLLRVFEKIKQYDPTQRFSPWLFTIAIRLATDHQRKKTLPTTANDPSLSVIDSQPSPAQQVVAQENNDDMWAVAQRVLKTDQWTALWLLYGEGQTVNEVATSLNRSTVSVRVLLHRARKKLTPHLAQFTAHSTVESPEEPEPNSATLPIARAES